METHDNNPQESQYENKVSPLTHKWTGGNVSIKVAFIVFIALLLFLPRFFLMGLINERQGLRNNVVHEITHSWGQPQKLVGPYMVIPYYYKQDSTAKRVLADYVIFPNTLDVRGDVTTTKKHRSIYEVMLYESKLKIESKFTLPDFNKIKRNNETFLFDQAYLAMGVNDLKGVNAITDAKVNGEAIQLSGNNEKLSVSFDPSVNTYTGSNASSLSEEERVAGPLRYSSCLVYPMGIQNGQEISLSANMVLRGSESLQFSPTAKSTTVEIKSPFKDPSFNGKFLPDNTIDDKGFKAQWQVSGVNSGLPSDMRVPGDIDLADNYFGVQFTTGIDNYVITSRAIKYMLLIIGLVFICVFITEYIENIRIHPIQYVLIGIAVIIFFTLLLAISEYLRFNISYIISAIATTILIYLYSKSLFKNAKSSNILLLLLATLYGYIFTLIQIQKATLLVGAIGLFIILALIMYATRKIRWYEDISVASS